MTGLNIKYFVLNPTSSDKEFAKASQRALNTFADYIISSNKQLALDIWDWVDESKKVINE